MKADPKALLKKIRVAARKVWRYKIVTFIIFIAVVYGYVIFQINTLTNAQPSDDAVSSQLSHVTSPKISQSAITQLQTLHDNSVNVQTLFPSDRQDPFNN